MPREPRSAPTGSIAAVSKLEQKESLKKPLCVFVVESDDTLRLLPVTSKFDC